MQDNNETQRNHSISVVMCTYNGEKYLREQIDSILRQTYPILELIVQDDCSTDHTCQIVEEYAAKYPFVKLFRNEKQLGINRNFFSAMSRAQGEFIAISDQDDIWVDDKLEIQMEYIGQCDICTSSYYVDSIYNNKMSDIRHPSLSMERRFFENDIPGHTMLIRKNLFEALQLPAPIFYDHYLVIWANFRNGISVANQPLNWHRPHKNNATHLISETHRHSNPFVPYISGLSRWNKLHQMAEWNNLYHIIEEQTASNQKLSIPHKISVFMQKKGIIVLFRISCLFTKHKNLFYPKSKGFRSCIQAFFYPLMHAYYHYAEFRAWNEEQTSKP